MNFDIYIIGGHSEQTPYGLALSQKKIKVGDSVSYKRLKVKVKKVLDNLAHCRYNTESDHFISFEVYPAGATSPQFPAYKLLTDDPVPHYNEFMEVRNRTGNFDPLRRWKAK